MEPLAIMTLAEVERFTRRDFLRRAVLLGFVLASSCSAGTASPQSDGHLRRLGALGTALLAAESGSGAAFDPARVEPFIRKIFPEAEIDLAHVVRLLTQVVSLEPVFRLRFRRFESLPKEEQEKSLRGWLESRFESRRMVVVLLRTLCAMSHYSREEVWPELGYDGPWVGRLPIPHTPVRVASSIVSADDSSTPESLSAHTVVVGFGAGGGWWRRSWRSAASRRSPSRRGRM